MWTGGWRRLGLRSGTGGFGVDEGGGGGGVEDGVPPYLYGGASQGFGRRQRFLGPAHGFT